MTIDEMISKRSNDDRYEFITEDDKKRQMALGYGWGKRIGNSSFGVDRWLDNDTTIEFTNPKFTNRNVEFEINNNPNHKIWLSQLQGVFMNDNNRGELYSGLMTLKDGTKKAIRTLSPQKFWDIVKGRKFRVSIDENARLLIDDWNEQVRRLLMLHRDYSKVVDYIFEKLDAKEYNLITGMTKAGRCYDLIEV
jgi:hypothetical protein